MILEYFLKFKEQKINLESLFNIELFLTTIELFDGKTVSIWDISGQVQPEYYKSKFCQQSDGNNLKFNTIANKNIV